MRWIALAIVSFTMLCGYHFEKVTSAIKTALVVEVVIPVRVALEKVTLEQDDATGAADVAVKATFYGADDVRAAVDYDKVVWSIKNSRTSDTEDDDSDAVVILDTAKGQTARITHGVPGAADIEVSYAYTPEPTEAVENPTPITITNLLTAIVTEAGEVKVEAPEAKVEAGEIELEAAVKGWTDFDFGFFRFSYMWLNVFAGMLVIGGIILDKKGVRFTGIMACIVMLVGASTCYYALAGGFPVITQVWLASAGFAIFCMGDEVAGITVSKIIVKWFKGKELALAMGLEMAAARMGTGIALAFGLAMAVKWGIPAPILFGIILIVIGTLGFIFYTRMDRKLDASEPAVLAESAEQKNEDAFKFSDILQILTNHGFWLIAVLCVLFYSAVFPYLDFAVDLMVQKYGIDPKYAGYIPSLLPFGTILLTPVFGTIYDRKGKGASIMALGAVLLIIVHTIFSIPAFDHWGYALFAVLLLGIGFSLVPSAMWPSVPKLIPEKQLGTAYAMIFFIQNIGLGLVPLLIGWVLGRFCITSEPGSPKTYDYTLPMVIFVSFGVLALIVAMMLKATDRKKGYGLELPNIKKS